MANYKTERLREIRHIIWEEYNDMFPENEMLLAHIYTECPTLTFDCAWNDSDRFATSDWGWSIGLGQWHMRWRYKDWLDENGYYHKPGHKQYTIDVRNHFFTDFPEMKEWKNQARKYVAEMKGCTETHNLPTCIRKHNWKAGLPYLYKVQNNVYEVRKLLNDKAKVVAQ